MCKLISDDNPKIPVMIGTFFLTFLIDMNVIPDLQRRYIHVPIDRYERQTFIALSVLQTGQLTDTGRSNYLIEGR